MERITNQIPANTYFPSTKQLYSSRGYKAKHHRKQKPFQALDQLLLAPHLTTRASPFIDSLWPQESPFHSFLNPSFLSRFTENPAKCTGPLLQSHFSSGLVTSSPSGQMESSSTKSQNLRHILASAIFLNPKFIVEFMVLSIRSKIYAYSLYIMKKMMLRFQNYVISKYNDPLVPFSTNFEVPHIQQSTRLPDLTPA